MNAMMPEGVKRFCRKDCEVITATSASILQLKSLLRVALILNISEITLR